MLVPSQGEDSIGVAVAFDLRFRVLALLFGFLSLLAESKG
jgi:hypothetical protein